MEAYRIPQTAHLFPIGLDPCESPRLQRFRVLPTAALVGALVAQDRPDGFEDELDVQAKERLGNDAVIDARHESFIEDPKSALRRLCGFLDLAYTEDYLGHRSPGVGTDTR